MKMDIMNLIKLKASLSKAFHIPPSEIDAMPMWEFELYVKTLNELVEEENDKQQKEMDKYHVNDYKNMANPKNMQKMTQPPNFANMQTPKFNTGNMSGFK